MDPSTPKNYILHSKRYDTLSHIIHLLSSLNLNWRCFWGGFQLTLITEVFSHLCWNVSSFGFEVSASQISASTLR